MLKLNVSDAKLEPFFSFYININESVVLTTLITQFFNLNALISTLTTLRAIIFDLNALIGHLSTLNANISVPNALTDRPTNLSHASGKTDLFQA